jgi:hypothetical protein
LSQRATNDKRLGDCHAAARPALHRAAILVRAGPNRLAQLTPRGPVIRYERTRPGELVHLDIKPLARILRVGHRIHGDRRQKVEGAGYEYAHVAVDDYSRVADVEVLPDQRGGTTAAFLRRTICWFARRGLTVERAPTDNGGAYRSAVFAHVARVSTAVRPPSEGRPVINLVRSHNQETHQRRG